jgi:hypothetical protein
VLSIIPSIIYFRSFQILSSEPKLLSPSYLESRGKIPFKGGSLSHPEIPISECEPFFLNKFKFSKGFHLIQVKMTLFDFILNEFKELKY